MIRELTALTAMPERDEEDDTVLRISSINEHGEAPDGSVWRNIVINGEHYTIPYEVAMWFVHRGDQRDAQRELLREALSALEPFAERTHNWDAEPYDLEIELNAFGRGIQPCLHVDEFRRARAAADKIRAALTQEKKT